jgi:hypothetical protein
MKLYKLQNGLGIFYVISTDPTTAIKMLEATLNLADYGFSSERIVYTSTLLANEIENKLNKEKPFLSDGSNLIIQKENK